MVKGKVLVVDDSDDTREVITTLLELESFTVVTAADGRAGIDMAEAERPDLILTDINMPVLNGIEMIKMLRGQPAFGNVPILAMTAYGSNVAAEALSAGADRTTAKPIDFNLLIGGIKQLLAKTGINGKASGV